MCDTSDLAIGAVLEQHINNKQHVIDYSSRTLNDAQVNYTTIEKEFLTVVFALEKFRHTYLGPKHDIHRPFGTSIPNAQKRREGLTHSLVPYPP